MKVVDKVFWFSYAPLQTERICLTLASGYEANLIMNPSICTPVNKRRNGVLSRCRSKREDIGIIVLARMEEGLR